MMREPAVGGETLVGGEALRSERNVFRDIAVSFD
jgi:hypothetical protein